MVMYPVSVVSATTSLIELLPERNSHQVPENLSRIFTPAALAEAKYKTVRVSTSISMRSVASVSV